MTLMTIIAQAAAELTPQAAQSGVSVTEGAANAFKQSWFIQGGPLMFIILGVSIIGIAVFIERLVYLRKVRVNSKKLMASIKIAIRANRVMEAIGICNNVQSPVANILKAGLENYKKSPAEIRTLMEDAASSEIPKLEQNLWLLSVAAKVSPMLGLLGTVLGMIQSFTVMAANQFDPGQLAGGISVALLTTALGLIVAIPLLLGYSYLVTSVNSLISEMETRGAELIAVISQRGGDSSGADTFKI